MASVIINTNDKEDSKLIFSLAKRLKLKVHLLTDEEMKDNALAYAIEEGRKTGYVSESEVLSTLKSYHTTYNPQKKSVLFKERSFYLYFFLN